MKKIAVVLFVLISLFSCKPKEKEITENELISNEGGWEIVSLTIYGRDSTDNTSAICNYRNLGNLKFTSSDTGLYTYDGQDYSFSWYLADSQRGILFSFDYNTVPDCQSPFVYYVIYGEKFYTTNYAEYIQNEQFEISRMSKTSFILDKGSTDIIISKVE